MPKSKRKKILWVEDEAELIGVYKETIRTMGGIDVEFIQLGQEAIDRVKEIEEGKSEKPDLIMLDLLLPDINGDRVCEVIRETSATKNIPVFVLTNYSGEQMAYKMKEDLKVKKYLIKTEWEPSKLMPLLKKTLK